MIAWPRTADGTLMARRIGKNAFQHIGHEIVFGNSMNRSADNSENAGRVASLLDQTLAAALQNKQTVTSESKSISLLIEGVRIRDIPTHLDERASVVEIYDLRWQWHPAPFVSAHCFTVRPDREDRYFMLLQEPIARTDCKN
jgi:hypothetical protein